MRKAYGIYCVRMWGGGGVANLVLLSPCFDHVSLPHRFKNTIQSRPCRRTRGTLPAWLAIELKSKSVSLYV